MKKSILFSVLVVGATLLQAQSITVHQTCGQNGQVLVIETNGHECVDLGLPSGTLWATCNVGATTPEGYGNYYAWGETSAKETYNWSTYFDTNDGGSTFTKYKNEGGKTVLDPEDDAAHVNWGGNWRMPTEAEWQELLDNCTWTSTTQNGIKGNKVTSNKAGYTDKFIFLPTAGRHDGGGLNDVGSFGYYWSSSLLEYYSNYAWRLNFLSGGHGLYNGGRCSGLSVRPVLQPSSISYSLSANDTIRIYSNGCDDYQTFIGSHGGQLTMTANSDQWSHFVQWQDGNTDNPRTITTNGNADYTAYFEAYKYSVQVQSNDAARGSAYISKVVKESTIEYNESVGTFDAGSEVYLAYQANYGYHFDKWSDGNTSQQRSFILTKDTTFTATFAKNVYSITKKAEHGTISGNSSAEYLDYVTLTAVPDYGYHFTQWSDGVTDNPRTIELTSDTTFTALFAPNQYTLSLQCDENQGSVEGAGVFDYLTEVQISATPVYGYHFSSWSDGNTANPRTYTITKDIALTADFAINKYALNVSCNAEQGSVTGSGSYNYLSNCTIEAIPNYGYHFTQWSDGNTDNPRTIELRQDTTLEAIFAVDKYGTCGDNLQLTWRYDTGNQTLTISGEGDLTTNMRYGVEAVKEMRELVIEDGVGVIGNEAFADIKTLSTIILGKDVRELQERVFYNCNNLTAIYNYRKTPASATSNTFEEVDKYACTIYVLAGSEEMFRSATGWKDFYSILTIGASETTVTDNTATVVPSANSATFTWPVSNEAASYTIDITKDGVLFCHFTFNANGQLTDIAFAPGRDGQSMAPAAVMTANGLQFTVTGLNSNTKYGYSLTAKDANEQPIATYSGSFTTTSEGVATGIGNTPFPLGEGRGEASKLLRNGQLFILRDGKTYTVQGQEIR